MFLFFKNGFEKEKPITCFQLQQVMINSRVIKKTVAYGTFRKDSDQPAHQRNDVCPHRLLQCIMTHYSDNNLGTDSTPRACTGCSEYSLFSHTLNYIFLLVYIPLTPE